MKRVKLLGYEIDTYDFQGAVAKATELMQTDKVTQVVTINPEMFETANIDNEFSQILKTAEMVIPDGIGVKIGLKLTGQNVDRIAGIDFAREMINVAADNNLPVALIGAKPEILEKSVNNLKSEIKNLNIVYFQDGYFKDTNKVFESLKQTAPKLILVALGSPKQEKFIYEAKKCLNPALMIGVGGSFDVWSGVVERAPKIYQKLGLEWLYRTLKQPERFKRIFPTLPLFVLKVLKYRIGGDKC